MHFKKVGISTLKLPHQGFCFKFDPITSFPGTRDGGEGGREGGRKEGGMEEGRGRKEGEGGRGRRGETSLLTPLRMHTCTEHSTSIEDVDRFIEALKQKAVSGATALTSDPVSPQTPPPPQDTIHTTSLARRLLERELKGRPNLRCLEFPSFFASGFIQ